MPTLIRPLAQGAAKEASWISVQAFNESEVLTALRNGSGNLELITWHTGPGDSQITRGADSFSVNPVPGTAKEVALALIGRTAITAVRSGAGRLLLITFDVPPGLATMTRVWDSGTAALEARQINIVAVSDTILVTAVRAGNGDLLLIPWRLDSDQKLVRLDPEGVRASDVSNVRVVTMTRVDANNVMTAIITEQNTLELIGWSVSDSGEINQWAPAPATAGVVSDISLTTVGSSDGVTTDIVTAVKNGNGNLLLIAWRLSPVDGTIVRLTPDGIEAGTASDITVCMGTTEPNGRPTIVASMRRGSDNLEIITFELLANGADGATFVRTGEAENKSGTDVTWTSLAGLDPGRIVSAIQVDGDLQLTTYSLSAIGTTLIKPLAEQSAGESSWIAAKAFNENEVLTALRNGSGNLELIGWLTAPGDFAITRAATNSDHDAFAAQEVSLELMGRSAITAVRNGDDRLQLDVWSVPDGLASMDWISDSGEQAGEASHIAIVALSDTLLVTAVRAGNGELLLIPWALTSNQTLSRLDPEGVRPRDDSDVSFVTIARVDANNVVTAVRNGEGLELIGWSVSDAGQITQWAQSPGYAGVVTDIALASIGSSDGVTTDVVTAVQNGKGNLLLIAWRLSPGDGTITRLTPDGFEGGPAIAISVCMVATAPSGTPTILTSMRRGFTRLQGQNIQHIGMDNLGVIAFELLPDGSGGVAFVRTGDLSNAANTKVAETAFAPLETGRVLSVLSMDDALQLSTYSVTDAAITPAPSTILELQYKNPQLYASTDTSWAKSHGTYPLHSRDEWVQVLAPHDDYETTTLVGTAGWVVAPEMSGADVPYSHPFGFDWEFEIVLDDANGYQGLLSPASAVGGDDPNRNPILLANALGISAPRGLLGMEWDKNLLPQSLRARVDHGDRVALLGRWIIDEGHDSWGFYRTEIHPPLALATGSVEHDAAGIPFTRVLFMSRPFLCGQTFVEDADDAYDESVSTDGSLLDHLINQIKDLINVDSSQVEAHPRIMPRPFQGTHPFQFIVRPPPLADSSKFDLVVSFKFVVRHGCTIRVTGTHDDAICVDITLDDKTYIRPNLPARTDRNYFPDELDTLSPGAGWKILVAEAIASALAGIFSWAGPWVGAYVTFILFLRGIQTDEYAKLDEIDILDAAGAVENVLADNIPAAQGIISDDAQPYPFHGWMEARWVTRQG